MHEAVARERLILLPVPRGCIVVRLEVLNDSKNRDQVPTEFTSTEILALNR
jgi:hypothetical protein